MSTLILSNVEGVLSRSEMKKLMAGAGSGCDLEIECSDEGNTVISCESTGSNCEENEAGTCITCGNTTTCCPGSEPGVHP